MGGKGGSNSMFVGSGYGNNPRVMVSRQYDENGNIISESPVAGKGGKGGGSGQGKGDLSLEMMLQYPEALAAALKPAFAGENIYSRGYEAITNAQNRADEQNVVYGSRPAKQQTGGRSGGSGIGGVSSGGFGGGNFGFSGSPNYERNRQEGMQRKMQKQSMQDQLYMLDEQRRRERDDRSWKLAKLQELLGNAGLSDTETEETEQLVNNAGRWDKVPIRTTKTGTRKTDLLNMLMGAL